MADEVLTARIKFDMGRVASAGSGGGNAAGASAPAIGKSVKSGVAGFFSNVISALAPLAILASLKPIADLLKIILNFALFGIILLLKGLWESIKTNVETLLNVLDFIGRVWEILQEGFKVVKETLSEWLSKAIEWIKGLPILIWEKLKEGFVWLQEKLQAAIDWLAELPSRIWGAIKEGFAWIREKASDLWERIIELKDVFIEWLGKAVDWIKELPSKIWDAIKEGFNWVKDVVSNVWESIKSLPEKIWNKLKDLGITIADAIKNIIPNINPFSTSVDDAIITKEGKVIKTNPQDTIIATKNPGGTGNSRVFNFYGVTPQEMMDTIKRELANDVNKTSRF